MLTQTVDLYNAVAENYEGLKITATGFQILVVREALTTRRQKITISNGNILFYFKAVPIISCHYIAFH